MTKVAILPVITDQGRVSYRAVAGTKQSLGPTVGAALDALTAQLSVEESSTLVIVQSRHPDQFFTAAQQQRLDQLMAHWRTAHDHHIPFPAEEQAELTALVEAEVQAATQRAAALADEAGL